MLFNLDISVLCELCASVVKYFISGLSGVRVGNVNYLEFFEHHRGKVIGVALGLAFGWFSIAYGFWKALFVTVCVGFGYYVGKRVDERLDLGRLWDKLFKEK